jgi:hypothetical protein
VSTEPCGLGWLCAWQGLACGGDWGPVLAVTANPAAGGGEDRDPQAWAVITALAEWKAGGGDRARQAVMEVEGLRGWSRKVRGWHRGGMSSGLGLHPWACLKRHLKEKQCSHIGYDSGLK